MIGMVCCGGLCGGTYGLVWCVVGVPVGWCGVLRGTMWGYLWVGVV